MPNTGECSTARSLAGHMLYSSFVRSSQAWVAAAAGSTRGGPFSRDPSWLAARRARHLSASAASVEVPLQCQRQEVPAPSPPSPTPHHSGCRSLRGLVPPTLELPGTTATGA